MSQELDSSGALESIAELYRDGELVRAIRFTGARTIIVPLPDQARLAHVLPMTTLPAEVLKDKHNPEFDHYFPEVESKRDEYKLSGRDGMVWRYDYSETRTTKHRQR